MAHGDRRLAARSFPDRKKRSTRGLPALPAPRYTPPAMFVRTLPRVVALLLVIGLATACARQDYVARPLAMEEAAQQRVQRDFADAQLEQHLRSATMATGQWPLRQWGLEALTLAAFYFREDLQAARARGAAARAQVEVAAQRPPMIATPRIERHSGEGESGSPWSLGFELEIPLIASGRRAALLERAEAQALAAELEIGETAWRIRSELRAQLLELHRARQLIGSLERQVGAQQSVVDMLQRRLQEGYAGVSEVDIARLRLAEAEAAALDARTQAERALGGVAQAVGVPVEAVRAVELSFAAFEGLPDAPEPASARREALLNRVDLRRGLLDFAVADAEVKLAVAAQNPTVSITPGFLWDQGDDVWSLATDLLLPASMTHAPAIRAASARREAAAVNAQALQSAVIGEVDARSAVYAQAREAALAAGSATRTQLARSAQVQRQFDAGQADRLEYTLARIESLLVERRAQAAHGDAQRSLGHLEDAMQKPVVAGPVPPVNTDDRGQAQ